LDLWPRVGIVDVLLEVPLDVVLVVLVVDVETELVDELVEPPQATPPTKVAQVPDSSLAALKLSETAVSPLPLTMSSFAL
jgi:hypothetical protein